MKRSCKKQQQGFKPFLSCANTCIKKLIFGKCFFPSIGFTPTFGVWTFVRSRILRQQYQFWYKITKSTFTLLKQSPVESGNWAPITGYPQDWTLPKSKIYLWLFLKQFSNIKGYEYESDLHSNEHYLSSSENKA